MKCLHQNGEHNEASAEHCQNVLVEECLDVCIHERKVSESFKQHEIDDGCQSNASVNAYFPADFSLDVEGEDNTGDPLNQCAEHECDGHRQENTHDDFQRFRRVQIVGHAQCGGIASHFDNNEGKRGSEEFKHHRDGG